MKASNLIEQLTNLVSRYGDLDLKIHVEQYGNNLCFYDLASIYFEHDHINNIFLSEIEVFLEVI